jgi:hypothetical protein
MKKLLVLLTIVIALTFSSCYSVEHTVGDGSKTGVVVKQKQWYAVWGLVPIIEVDSKALAGGAENYTVTTKHTFVDMLISSITSAVSICCQTVEVTK